MTVSPEPDPPGRTHRPRARAAVMTLVAVLALGGIGLVGYGLTQQQVAATPASASQGGSDPPAPPAAAPPRASPPATGPGPLPPSPPTSISIPAIGVTSPVNPVGLNPDRTLEVPAPGPLYDQAAWYRGSVTPGEIGPSVIIGHVDSAANGPSVFFDLAALAPTERFTITRADGTTLTFQVDGVRTYPKDAFPTDTVYGGTARPEVRLITCGGPFDSTSGSYRSNTVVYAHLVTEDDPPHTSGEPPANNRKP
ncbi:MAG: class F sortase [Pseudonocardiaceae bacterium]|nr:class F sortase [Pseudonocardiaceae bacterium]